MSLNDEAQNEDLDDVVTLWGDVSEAVVVPNSALLFNGEFYRLGPDLYIVNDGAANYRIPEYFAGETAADLHDPNGAVLRGDLVERLAGPIAPGQYAQAGAAPQATPIGQVETAQGAATVQRADGTEEVLQPGSPIYQNDVLMTAEDASLSVTFTDGTVFSLSAASRMVIDALIYDPEADDNSGTFSLIQGGFVFIAGQVAKTGGMEVNTPSSTMGIRGTTVVVQIGTVDGVDTTEISLTSDPDGSTGQVEVRDVEGNLVATITETDTKWIVSASTGESREVPRSLVDAVEDNQLIAEAFAAYRSSVGQTDGADAPAAPNATRAPQQAPPPEVEPLDPDVSPQGSDGIDAVPAPPPVETDEGSGEVEVPDSVDETLNAPEVDEGPIIVVSGPEDAGEEGAISGTVGDIGGDGTVFSLVDDPANGEVVLRPDGQFDYVPAPDFNGTDSFTFEATVPGGETVEGTVLVQVLPVNDAPEADDQAITVPEDGAVTGKIAARDIDGDNLSYVLGTPPTRGEVALLPDGSYSYSPEADFFGTDSFTVLVTDPDGESAQSIVSITISPVNDAPVITTVTGGNLGTVVEDGSPSSVKGRLTATDPDPGSSITWSGTSSAIFGAFVISASGAWRYVLDNAAADELGAGDTVVETMTATARDEFGAEVTQIIEVTVKGTNDAPTVAENTVIEVARDGTATGQLTATDIDSTGPLSFALSGDGPANGTVVIAADGSFTYTPTEGFVGIDRFSYTVSDEEGGVTIGQISAAVEGASGGADPALVDVTLTPQGGDAAAGVIDIDAVPATPGAINLIIAMDSSDSTGAAGWAAQREAVREAVVSLAERFEGSETSVEVQIIQYSDAARALQPFDLQDPDLPDAILSLPFLEGATGWDQALDEASRFLSSQPPGEDNLMLFLTNGVPPDGRWRSALKELNNPSEGDFTLDIQAFGFGTGEDQGLLRQIDPDPTFQATADDLAAALTQEPAFSPRLIELDVRLEADGQDQGSIADENSFGLREDGVDFELPLASIENIEALLGESNRINVTARFDTDGDDATHEVEHFSTDVIGKAGTGQTLSGQDGADLLFGSDAGDRIDGGAGNDVMFGFDGDDTLDGGAGDDVVLAGDGDDILRVADVPQSGELLDGGAGRDVLQIGLGGDVSEELIPALELKDIEAIDMDNGLANTLRISLADVIELSSTSDSELETLLDQALPESAVIYGDASDSLVLLSGEGGRFEKISETPVPDGKGNMLDIYSYVEGGNVLATLGVDTDIEVTGAVTVS